MVIDTKKNERDFEHLTLSDVDVVKYIILHRNKVDISYGIGVNININQAGDVFELNQELIALYASLENLITQCKFKDKQLKLLNLIFEGNTIQDICAMNIGYKKSATYDLLDRMVVKIAEANNKNWKEVIRNV